MTKPVSFNTQAKLTSLYTVIQQLYVNKIKTVRAVTRHLTYQYCDFNLVDKAWLNIYLVLWHAKGSKLTVISLQWSRGVCVYKPHRLTKHSGKHTTRFGRLPCLFACATWINAINKRRRIPTHADFVRVGCRELCVVSLLAILLLLFL